MNHRLQLSPISGIRESQARIVGERPSAKDIAFLRSWFVYDSSLASGCNGLNWSAILGLGLAVMLSISFWIGLGLLIWG
jgi:hypothetical protein